MVKITKLIGGGASWYYAWDGHKILGSAHEDDHKGMEKLRNMVEDMKKKDPLLCK